MEKLKLAIFLCVVAVVACCIVLMGTSCSAAASLEEEQTVDGAYQALLDSGLVGEALVAAVVELPELPEQPVRAIPRTITSIFHRGSTC